MVKPHKLIEKSIKTSFCPKEVDKNALGGKIYLTFICLLLEYPGEVWDYCTSIEVERVQRLIKTIRFLLLLFIFIFFYRKKIGFQNNMFYEKSKDTEALFKAKSTKQG